MITKIVDLVSGFFADELQKPGRVIAVFSEPEGWRVQIEVAEEVEYMRRRARNDLMAIYEVQLNPALEIIAFERKLMRERSSTQINEVRIS